MTPETLYQPLNSIRTEYRLRMNRSADLAAKFAAEDDMQSVSEHSTESERCREAFQAMNRAIFAVDEYYAALSAQQREPVVRVKELKWTLERRHGIDVHVGRGLGFMYEAAIKMLSPGWIVTIGGETIYNSGNEGGEDAAKSAAQADYEQRIMAAIEIAPQSDRQPSPGQKQVSETGKELLKNTEQPMNNAAVSVGELAGFFVTEFPHLLTMLTQIEVARALLSRYSVRKR